MSFPITAHFAVDEFACRSGVAYPVDQVDEDDPAGGTWFKTRLVVLCGEVLEVIRAEAGDAVITVDSGYRTPSYDERLYEESLRTGGVVAPPSRSQHPQGRAADIRHATLPPGELHALILRLFEAGRLPQLGGLGIYPHFVHVDVRPRPSSGHLARWTGDRASNQLPA